MDLRFAKEQDFNEIKDLWLYCFDDCEEFVDYYFSSRYRPENSLVITENERVIASLQMNQYRLKVANNTIDTSYIVGISTLPEKRGSGLMKRILPTALQAIKDKGQSFALMMAIDSLLYLKYQFAYICEQLCFNYNTAECKRERVNVSYKQATAEDALVLSNIYKQKYKHTFIKLHRDADFFRELIQELNSEDVKLYLVKDKNTNEYTGYFTYCIEDEVFYVREWCYLNTKALMGIMNFIYQHNMQASKAEIITANNDYIKHLTPINKHTEINIFPFIMGRIIDVSQFLNFDLPHAKDCELVIKVTDNYIAENNNNYLLRVNNHRLTATVTDKKQDLELAIDALTQISCGYLSANISREMNLVKVYNEAGFEVFSSVFRDTNNYLNEYI